VVNKWQLIALVEPNFGTHCEKVTIHRTFITLWLEAILVRFYISVDPQQALQHGLANVHQLHVVNKPETEYPAEHPK
jgi:hypothetical protein